jgi:hypothetical protein
VIGRARPHRPFVSTVAVVLALACVAIRLPTPPALAATGSRLPSLPSVARVRVDAGRDRVLILQEVLLPRGEWKGGDLDLYVAFGAPGAPEAFEARLLSVPDGALEPVEGDGGEAVALDRASRRPPTAALLLGRPQMAGSVLHIKEASFRRALAPGNMAAIRLRSLIASPSAGPDGAREVLVRLGIEGGPPLTLGRLQLVSLESRPWISRVDARLCGQEADPYPLAIAVTPPTPPAGPPGPIAPVLAVRHATDDLCVRYWAP